MSISSVSERLKVKYMNFTIAKKCIKNRCFCDDLMKASLLPKMSIFNLKGRGLKKEKWRGGGGGGGGDYSREAIN